MTALSYMVATADPWILLCVGFFVGAMSCNAIFFFGSGLHRRVDA